MKEVEQKNRHCLFVNLADQLAIQNNIVQLSVDEIIDTMSDDDGMTLRADWPELRKTAENMITQDMATEVPAPKSLGRVHKGASERVR